MQNSKVEVLKTKQKQFVYRMQGTKNELMFDYNQYFIHDPNNSCCNSDATQHAKEVKDIDKILCPSLKSSKLNFLSDTVIANINKHEDNLDDVVQVPEEPREKFNSKLSHFDIETPILGLNDKKRKLETLDISENFFSDKKSKKDQSLQNGLKFDSQFESQNPFISSDFISSEGFDIITDSSNYALQNMSQVTSVSKADSLPLIPFCISENINAKLLGSFDPIFDSED